MILRGLFPYLLLLGFTEDGEDLEAFMEMSLDQLMTIEVSTSSKTGVSSQEAPGIVTVLTRSEIRNLGATTLADVIRMVPGFLAGGAIQGGSHGNFMIRGSTSLYSEDVLILKDGVRMNDPITGGPMNYSPDYPVDNIRQIEIIRGPGSALYGANAFLGVINIITDPVDEPITRVRLRGGTSASLYGSVQIQRAVTDDFAMSLYLDYGGRTFDEIAYNDQLYLAVDAPIPGFNIAHENYQSMDRTSYFQGELKLKYKDVIISWENHNKENYNQWGLGVPTEPYNDLLGNELDLNHSPYRNNSKVQQQRWSLSTNKQINDHWSLQFFAAHADIEGEFFVSFANFRFSDNYAADGFLAGNLVPRSAKMTMAELGATWNGGEGHSLVMGLNVHRDEVPKSYPLLNSVEAQPGHPLYNPAAPFVVGVTTPYRNGDFLAEADRQVTAIYAQYTWKPRDSFTFTGGIRGDDYNDFGETANPRLAMVYVPNKKWSFKTLYGRAFRAPSILETNSTLSVILPNPDVEPETVSTIELQSTLKPTENWFVTGTLYHYHIDDSIQQLPTGNPNNTLEAQTVNAGTREGEGLELETRFKNSKGLDFFLNYSYAETTDTLFDVESPVQGVPTHSMNAGFTLERGLWTANLSGSRRWDWEPQPAVAFEPIPGLNGVIWDQLDFEDYTMAHLSAAYQLKGMRLSLDVRNLTDERRVYPDQHLFLPNGVVLEGREIMLGFQWHLE